MFSKLKDYYSAKKTLGTIEYIVAGLGNPGKEYENTRHNAGFLAVNYIAEKENIPMKKLKFNSFCGDGTIGGKRVLLMKPDTFMNKSGEAIILAAKYYNIPPERIVVICDDVEQKVGNIRIRRKGSHGGQNGLKNITALLHSEDYPRIRIGIDGKLHPQMDLADWVLSKLSGQDLKLMKERYPDVLDAVSLILNDDIETAMQRYNQSNNQPE